VNDLSKVAPRRATLDIVAQVAGRVVNLALGVVVTALLVRSLGEVGFGQWSTILVTTQLVGYFANLGLEQVTVGRAAVEHEHEPELLGALVSLRLLASVPVSLASAGVILLLAESRSMAISGVVISATVLVNTPAVLRAAFQLRIRNDVAVAIQTANSVLWGAAVIAIAIAGGGIVAFSVAFLAVSALTSALQGVLALRTAKIDVRGSRPFWRPLVMLALPVTISTLLITAYARIDQILVFELAGERQAGLYGAVYRVLEQSHLIPQALMTTLFPIIAAAHGTDRARLQRMLQRSADYLAMSSLGALAFTIVAARAVVVFLFGDDFAEAAPALPILMGAFVVISFGYLTGNMVLVLRLQRRFVWYAVLALVFNVGLNAWLVPKHGFLAAAWITLATEILVVSLTARMVMQELDFRPGVARILRSVVAAAILGAGLVGLKEIGAPLGVLATAALVAYPLLLFSLRALEPREVVELLRERGA
jgi:O-antigen/teichoic acid export membrane protein